MTIKIKTLIGFLVILAVFTAYIFIQSTSRSGLSFGLDLGSTKAEINNNFSKEPPSDVDKDGLTNREESYWDTDFQNPDTDGDGYLDGEEIASGHNPIIPGPNDLLDNTDNLTNNLAGLVTSGLYAEDLKKTSSDQKFNSAIDNLSLSIISDFYKDQPELPINLSFTLLGNSRVDQIGYLEEVSKIIKEDLLNFPQKIDLNKLAAEQKDFFAAKSEQFKLAYDKVLKMPIPKNWVSIHKQVLDILNKLAVNYSNIGSYNADPLKSVLSLNEIGNINGEIKSVLEEVNSKIEENNLSLNGSFYQVLALIYRQ